MLANKGLGIAPALWSLLPAHIDFLLWGLDTATCNRGCILDPATLQQSAPAGKCEPSLDSGHFANAGIWIDGVSPFLLHLSYLNLMGRGLLILAAMAFALHAWPRVKPSRA